MHAIARAITCVEWEHLHACSCSTACISWAEDPVQAQHEGWHPAAGYVLLPNNCAMISRLCQVHSFTVRVHATSRPVTGHNVPISGRCSAAGDASDC